MNWPRTLGFAAIQITTGLLVQLWCWNVHLRFQYFHRDGHGRALSNIYWDYSWTYTAFTVLLICLAIAWQYNKKAILYEITIRCGYWLLIVWVGFALIAMEMSFVPDLHLHGEDW